MFCQTSTLGHIVCSQFNDIYEDICTLLTNEGANLTNCLFNGYTYSVINGDKLEEKIAIIRDGNLGTKNKSADLIYSIIDGSTPKMHLVELKLRSSNFYYLDKASFDQKIIGSTSALGPSYDIDNSYSIIFDENRIEEATRFLFRLNPVLDPKYKAISLNDLYNKHFK